VQKNLLLRNIKQENEHLDEYSVISHVKGILLLKWTRGNTIIMIIIDVPLSFGEFPIVGFFFNVWACSCLDGIRDSLDSTDFKREQTIFYQQPQPKRLVQECR
jgi:hypothetical protein